jgi:hypothetical protein
MSGFQKTMADNVAELLKWHERRHLLEWPSCPAEPCTCLDAEFRRVWSK